MRLIASPREIRKGYKLIKRMARESFLKGSLSHSLEFINHCAILAQQFNWIYADDELEDLLASIGERIIPEKIVDYKPIKERVVFYDDFCTSFILALQYLHALVADGKEILYITTKSDKAKTKFDTILSEVATFPGVRVFSLPNGDKDSYARLFYQEVIRFQPEKVLLHIKAFSPILPALYCLPNVIDRYIINLADQTFWLGKKGIDYSVEFRPFGASVSMQRRGLKKEQLLMIPFYPVIDKNPFEGFPPECTPDKVIFFSGGDFYKVTEPTGTYWNLVKIILDSFPQVIFLFATKINLKRNHEIDRFIRDNNFQHRFIYIRFRKDINEVFKHCDIYMGTCPTSGSLMSQLAATNEKPILQFYFPGTPDDETEQALCFNGHYPISFRDEEAFLKEAGRLISDPGYRRSQGARLKNVMISEDQFNELVSKSLNDNRSHIAIEDLKFDYSILDNRWYDLERMGYTDTLSYLYGILGRRVCFNRLPTLAIKKYLRRFFLS